MDIWSIQRMGNYLRTLHQRVTYPFFFKRFGRRSRVLRPLKLAGTQSISIGENVYIGALAWLEALPPHDSRPKITIMNDAYVGNFAHIVSLQEVIIGRGALIADKVYIGDYSHGFADPNIPIKSQPLVPRKPVHLGDGCWIGEHAVILGASVGSNAVVGANSVVLHDVPDGVVVVGSPAKPIARSDIPKL